MNEDRIHAIYDREFTHNQDNSPYYDGPIIGEDCCEHGVMFCDDCEQCYEVELPEGETE